MFTEMYDALFHEEALGEVGIVRSRFETEPARFSEEFRKTSLKWRHATIE